MRRFIPPWYQWVTPNDIPTDLLPELVLVVQNVPRSQVVVL